MAKQHTDKQTICLCMIVKNETPVIRRCLDSLKGFIDHWVIVDTGSTDGTQDMIRSHLQDIKGELIERPWVNFAHNRSEALIYARGKADYVFIIDADEVIEFDEGFILPQLTYGAYHFTIESGGCSYYKTQLVDNTLTWSYKNVLHEYIHSEEHASEAVLPGVKTLRFPDGARARDPETYRKDAEVLERALKDEPENTRYQFYLAQSYRDANEPGLAIEHYKRRAEAGGWNEEVWYSLYQIAQLMARTDKPWPDVLEAYLNAFQYKPNRAGPLYHAGIHYQSKRAFHSAYLFLKQAMEIPYPADDRLFIEKALYDYLIPLEFAVCAFYVDKHEEAIRSNNNLLNSGVLPAELIERVIDNRRYSLDHLNPRREQSTRLPFIKVIIPFRDASPDLDNLIESLLYQDNQNCSFVFVDDGGTEDPTSRIALEDERFSLKRFKRSKGWGACISEIAVDDSNAVILPLCDHIWMASTESLSDLARNFAEYDCDLGYGQYRLQTGHLGNAMPFASQSQLQKSTFDRKTIFPLAFKAGNLDALPAFSTMQELAQHLFHACPFPQLHFNDTPLVILNDEAEMYCDGGQKASQKAKHNKEITVS